VLDERREQRGLRRPAQCDRRCGDDRRRIDARRRRAGEHQRAGGTHGHGLQGVAERQRERPAAAVGDSRRQRRHDGCRHQLQDGDQSRGGRPAPGVGIDEDRRPHSVFGHRETGERQLHPP
jgi:hypothetical protein